MINIKHSAVKWILPISIAIICFLTFHSTIIRIIARYGLVLLSFTGVSIIFYAFAGIFTKKRILKLILTICLFAMCIFVRYEIRNTHRPVRMKEDVLYILPPQQIDTTGPKEKVNN